MKSTRLSIGPLLAFGCFWGWLPAEEFPRVEKDHARGTLEGYELLHVYPQLQFPDTAPSPVVIDWEIGPEMPLPVKGGVAGVLNGHLVIAPGIGIREHDPVVQALNLETRKWVRLPDIPKAPVYTTGVVARNSIVVLGGRGGSRVAPEVGPSVQRLRYQDGRWVWDELPPLPRKIWYAGSTCVDDRWILISNGATGPFSGVNPSAENPISAEVWKLDLDQLEKGWSTAGSHPHRLLNPALAGVDGKLYIFGGAHYDPKLRAEYKKLLAMKGYRSWHNGYIRQKYTYELDLDSGCWQRRQDMPYPRSGGEARLYGGRYMLVVGGSGHSQEHDSVRPGRSRWPPEDEWRGYHDQILVYDRVKDMWSVLDRPMPYGMNTLQVTLRGETLYVTGGEPAHGFNFNTEDVVMIGRVRMVDQ